MNNMLILLMLVMACIFLGYWFRHDIKNLFPKKFKYSPDPQIKYNILSRVSATPIDKKKLDEYSLASRIDNKLKDLQDQLIRHNNEPGFELAPKDVIRYQAMIEILKTVTQT